MKAKEFFTALAVVMCLVAFAAYRGYINPYPNGWMHEVHVVAFAVGMVFVGVLLTLWIRFGLK